LESERSWYLEVTWALGLEFEFEFLQFLPLKSHRIIWLWSQSQIYKKPSALNQH